MNEMVEDKEAESIQIIEEIIIDENWKRKRKETFAIFCLQFFSFGMDFTIIQSTLWPYIKQGMHTSQPKLIYGVISSAKFIPPLFFNLLVSRWFDVHRRLQLIAIVSNALGTVGYVLYIILSSPFIPVFGITLVGFVFVIEVIINSEILRSYTRDESPGKLLELLIAYGCGETVGPIIVKLLDKVDFWIGSLHIMYFTMPCLILIIFSIIKLILMYFFVHDISRNHELNVNESQAEETGTWDITISMSCSLMIGNIVIMIIPKDLSDVINWILIIVLLISYTFCWISDNIFIIFTIGKLFDSSNQSFVEGIRMAVHLTATLIASLTSAYVYEYFMYLFPVYAVANVLLLVGMIVRRKPLCNPQVITE